MSENGIAGTVPRVLPSDTAFGMVAQTHQAAVLIAPLVALRNDGVPSRSSMDCSSPSVGGDVISDERSRPAVCAVLFVASKATAPLSTAAAAPGLVVEVSGVTGCSTPAAAEAAW
ncbi:hypothetical protein PICSAR104_03372 [Mycobacterium avium subsp. paratuberculosis]|nr:hypothetical protein PICSAR104_03372 [Mycobacterium avium subsp. paratuberculosis]